MYRFRNHLFVWILCLSLLASGCFKSKNVVNRIPPTAGRPMILDGVPYALPRTVIKATVPFTRVAKSPGEFEPYTPCFFSPAVAADRIRAESKTFKINPPTLSSRGEPDPNEHYIARIKGGYFENKTMLLEFNDDGVITKGDVSSENVAIDVAVKAVRTAISVGASLATGAGAVDATTKAARKLKLDKLEIDICRSIVVAEAASVAAASAKEAAKASGSAAAASAADQADAQAKAAENEIASAKGTLASKISLVETTKVDDNELTGFVNQMSANIVDSVVCYAKQTQQHSLNASAAAGAAAPNEAAETIKAAAKIDQARKLIGMTDKTVSPLGGPFPAECYKQEESGNPPAVGVDAAAFANGYVQARKKFERIQDLTEAREQLVAGNSAPQGLSADALKKMLDELDATITSYENTFFLGTKDTKNWSGNFEFRPGKSTVSDAYNTFQTSPVLLVFSKSDGICATSESREQGVKIDPQFAAKCPLPDADGRAVWLSVKRLASDDAYLGHMAAANLRDEQNGERGFYYRIPARAVVKLETGHISSANMALLDAQSDLGRNWRINEPGQTPPAGPFFVPTGDEMGRETMRIAQTGVVASIPASAAGRKTQYTIDFDESTGALKNFKLASNALLEKAFSDEVSGAAKDILDAKQARDKAKKEAKDELTQKKRELELLQTENAIEEEKKKKANSQQP